MAKIFYYFFTGALASSLLFPSLEISAADISQVKAVREHVIRNGEVENFLGVKIRKLNLNGRLINYQGDLKTENNYPEIKLQTAEGSGLMDGLVVTIIHEGNAAHRFITLRDGRTPLIPLETVLDGEKLDGVVDSAVEGTINEFYQGIVGRKHRHEPLTSSRSVNMRDQASNDRVQGLYDEVIPALYNLTKQ